MSPPLFQTCLFHCFTEATSFLLQNERFILRCQAKTHFWQLNDKNCGVEQVKYFVWKYIKSETRACLTNVTGASTNEWGWTPAAGPQAGSWWPGPLCASWCCSGSGSPLLWVLVAPWEHWQTSRCPWTPRTQRSQNWCLSGNWEGLTSRGWHRGCSSHSESPLWSLRRTRCWRRTGRPGTCCAPLCHLRCLDWGGLVSRFQRGCPESGPWGDGRA